MPDLGTAQLITADWVLLVLICVWLPIQEILRLPTTRHAIRADATDLRLAFYRDAISMLWLTTGCVALVWFVEDRDGRALGLSFDGDVAGFIGLAVAVLIAAVFLLRFVAVTRIERARDAYAAATVAAADQLRFMPRSRREYRSFVMLAVTAGITEEVVFRGYLIWALSTLLPVPAAAAASLLVFVVMHLYQGKDQLLPITAMGCAFTLLYLASGSIYPVVLAHVAIDVLGAATWRAASEPDHVRSPISASA